MDKNISFFFLIFFFFFVKIRKIMVKGLCRNKMEIYIIGYNDNILIYINKFFFLGKFFVYSGKKL